MLIGATKSTPVSGGQRAQVPVYPFPGGKSEIRAHCTWFFLSETICIHPAIDNTRCSSFKQNYETDEIRFDSTMASNRYTRSKFEPE
jgi:hypothetical protein